MPRGLELPTSQDNGPPRALRGYLLNVFGREIHGRWTICGVGRLETGETFALLDDRVCPSFYVRVSDLAEVRPLAPAVGAAVEERSETTMDGETVAEVTCPQLSPLKNLAGRLDAGGIRTYEADINHSRKYLINHGLRGAAWIEGNSRRGTGVDRVYTNPQVSPTEWEPELTVLVLDIETDREASEVYAVSLAGTGPDAKHSVEEIHLVGEPAADDPANTFCHSGERELLEALSRRIAEIDPDVISGWNVIDFDLAVLQRRFSAHHLPFNLGRTSDGSWYRRGRRWGGSRMVIYGRQVLDALRLVRTTLRRYDDYRLETVAQTLLGRGKTLHASGAEDMPEVIMKAYVEDRPAFARYCLEDSLLVRDILQAQGLVALSLRRSLLTGLPLEGAWGSVAAFEFLYISELHKRGMVAPSAGVDCLGGEGAPGGLVLPSRAGLYRHILVFDFRSLYPSIIRTFNIDPLAHVTALRRLGAQSAGTAAGDLITAPNGAVFDREPGILPGMLESLFAGRRRAQEDGDDLASYAYKILMNSFYGVLGTSGCRFSSERLAGAITEFGHYILRWTRDLFEAQGCKVLYGDTDSLFVDASLPDDIDAESARAGGLELCARMNRDLAAHVRERFGVESRLELEFEKYYRRLLLPVQRGGGRGRAKGYAGLRCEADGEKLEIVGMEAVRRDWTELAHALQRDLLDLLFHDAPREKIERRVGEWVNAVRSGRKDADLVYRKSLRNPLSSYTRTTPPHVKAARLMQNPSGVIRYVMTVSGPQPADHVSAPLDYAHYIAKQMEPIIRTISQACGLDADAAIRGERGLF